MIEFDDLDRAVAALLAAEEIVLTCHVGPDGDAMGSMLAVAHAARLAGKKVYPSFGPPYSVIPAFRFLPVDLLVAPESVPAHPQVAVSFDAASLTRLGAMAGPASRAEVLIVLDHHLTGAGPFGHLNLIDPHAAATAEIAHTLITAAGWPVDETVATCLLTGLVTDTGRFQYSNTRPSTLRLAAELVAAGARPDIIGQHIYEETPFGYLQVASQVLGRAHLDQERELVWTVLYQSDLKEAGIGLADTDPLIDLVRLPAESQVALLLKEQEDGSYKGSLRSRGLRDVAAIAAGFGGGGHHNAAGFSHAGPVESIVEIIAGELSALITGQ
ncbi:MAG TPA: bifunctional oligoribonuclease/PAP phosphatase NrnA [Acidimicrobiia bacterium]|nr:bifunctional oligoribonuclease/PAP phosphatase NrnA [Acidimicrobiia bacterium]